MNFGEYELAQIGGGANVRLLSLVQITHQPQGSPFKIAQKHDD